MNQHHIVHPITEALRHRRMQRGLSVLELTQIANVHRATIHHYEDVKCPLLARLDRWAKSLNFQIVLLDTTPPKK